MTYFSKINKRHYKEVKRILAELEEMGKQKSGGEEPLDVLNTSYGNADQLTNEMVGHL